MSDESKSSDFLLNAAFDAALMTEILALVDNAADEEVADYVKHADPDLARGFGIKPQNAPTFRERIKRQISGGKDFSFNLRRLLQRNRKLRYPAPLNVEFLKVHLPAIFALYGREKFLVSLLLDDRKELGEIAADAIDNQLPAATDNAVIEAYKEASRSLAQGLLQDLHEDFVPDEKAAGTADEGALRAAQSKIASLEEQLSATGRKRDESVAATKEIKARLTVAEAAAAKVPGLESALETAKTELIALKAKLKSAEAELADLKENQEQAVLALVQKELEEYHRKWIVAPEKFETACRETLKLARDGDVLARAREVMARQREMDRASGNRGQLQARMEALRAAREEATGLAKDAITPLPALKTVIDDLGQEIAGIAAKLGMDAPAPDFVGLAQARIAGAGDAKELQSINQWLDLMDEMGIVDARSMQNLYEAYHAKISLVYDTRQPVAIVPAREPQNALWRLKQGLAGNETMLLLLDGYNVILSLPDIYGGVNPDKSPGEEVRSMLTAQLQRIAASSPACEIRIYFDGPVSGARSISGNVKVIFSGGEGDHRADRAICDDLDYECRERSAMTRILITSDRELGSNAAQRGAQVVRVNEFAELLGG